MAVRSFKNPSWLIGYSICPIDAMETKKLTLQHAQSELAVGSPASNPCYMYLSRIGTDFEELEVLGSGGFGDVIKVTDG